MRQNGAADAVNRTYYGTLDEVQRRLDDVQSQIDCLITRLKQQRDKLILEALDKGYNLEHINKILNHKEESEGGKE